MECGFVTVAGGRDGSEKTGVASSPSPVGRTAAILSLRREASHRLALKAPLDYMAP
jgi:hypothetical protein